jgi:hypothetical protein
VIRCKIEIVPFGEENLTRLLKEIIIYNDVTGTPLFGNYKVRLKSIDKNDEEYKEIGKIKHHDRMSNVMNLVIKALKVALKNEKP